MNNRRNFNYMPDNRRRKNQISTKAVIALMAVVMLIGCAMGGTVAWLSDQTDPVVNTFTYGDINITLTETTGTSYKIIPGVDIPKDPKVTVTADSEDCWLFVKVEKSGTWSNEVTYNIDTGWTALPGHTNVYYREVKNEDTTREFSVLLGNKVTVSDSLTKAEIEELKNSPAPTLTFTAYAVQKEGIDNVADAWATANSTPTP